MSDRLSDRPRAALPPGVVPGAPLTALAPMQDVTDLAFMGVIAHYGPPDYFFTEFLRVHAQSRPEAHILRAIDGNATGRPIFAQLIGEDPGHLVRTVRALLRHPIAGIDLNLGCPAPKVYRKNVGGGLLREPARIAEILAVLRAEVPGLLTVKMRVGFSDTSHFDRILDLVNEHRVDLLTVHGRTVKDMYHGEVRYPLIAHAAARVRCPVLANGNVTSATRSADVLAATRSAGVMIGRHAIRNPWIFRQCREVQSGRPPAPITLAQVREYVERLYRATQVAGLAERLHVNKMKKYLNFVGQGVDPQGAFLQAMRRAESERDLFAICDRHLLAGPEREFSLEPFPGVVARPNCEVPRGSAIGCSLANITA